MKKSTKVINFILKTVSYILVAALASGVTYFLAARSYGSSKLLQLEALIMEQFIGEADQTAMEDAAAAAMVDALGDRWSYYIPASQYASHVEQMQNSFVGIGVTIMALEDGSGIEVQGLEPTGGALEVGIQIGDIIVAVDGQEITQIGVDAAVELVRGEENTTVKITVLRGETRIDYDVVRKLIQVQVASGQMLPGNIGLVKITDFNERCADETIAVIDSLLEQGAETLIFDLRFNPGGYKNELVEVLDYLLPEGDLFRSLFYTGEETVDKSNAKCLKMPMAVLVNGSSYSAAEFFAAALSEYEWATVVGQPTVGKSYFQHTIQLSDGSAVGLSVGKYFTPKGVSLAEVGGLQPDVLVEVDDETAAKIYAGLLPYEEDPQIQAAIQALQ